jgi:hypothetical protein
LTCSGHNQLLGLQYRKAEKDWGGMGEATEHNHSPPWQVAECLEKVNRANLSTLLIFLWILLKQEGEHKKHHTRKFPLHAMVEKPSQSEQSACSTPGRILSIIIIQVLL